MRCSGCGTDNAGEARYCAGCGVELFLVCDPCGARNPTNSRYCGQCAAPLRASAHPRAPGTVAQAERRQLTVLFCDVVSATALSERLDPEDLRELLREYQRRCAEVIRRYDGYVAQYLGDGLLAYFGFPLAHEDAPQRALLAGLAIVQAIAQLEPRVQAVRGVALSVRVGIHTGTVVVGEMGDAERHELLAVGETPNLAARVQAEASPNAVVISEATYKLTQGYFRFTELGERNLKGFSHPIELYQVEGNTGAKSRLEIASVSGLTPFVNREAETAQLLDRWRDASAGREATVLISGEPGIGKSRLVRVLRDRLSAEDVRTVECFCSPLYQSTALHPIAEMISHQLQLTRESSNDAKLRRLSAEVERAQLDLTEVVPRLATLLSIASDKAYPARPHISAQRERQATFDALISWLHASATWRPLLFVLEDLHWADPSTLEFLGLLAAREPQRGLMLLFTHRPEFKAPWPAVHTTEVSLARLQSEESEHILASVIKEQRLPAQVVREVLSRADGVPLYLEEITKAVLESSLQHGDTRKSGQNGSLAPFAIPATVKDSLASRLDRLGTGKAVMQLAASVGREFRFELLHAVSGLGEAELRAELERLVKAELLVRRGTPPLELFSFKHALIQDAAYESLLRSARQRYHRKIAAALVQRFPDIAADKPELLAQHYAGAGMNDEAVVQFQLAGQRALARSAYFEAIDVCEKALAQLLGLPASAARDRREIELRALLGMGLISTRGYAAAEVERNYGRAYALCEQFGDAPIGVVYGIWGVYLVRSDLEMTARLAAMLQRRIETSIDRSVLLTAHSSLGVRAFYRAEYAEAEACFRRALALFDADEVKRPSSDPAHMHNVEVYLYATLYLACLLSVCGDPDRAQRIWHETLALVEASNQPYALAMVFGFGAALWHGLDDARRTGEMAERAVQIALEGGYAYWLTTSNTHLGWAQAEAGQVASGIERIEQNLAMMFAAGGLLAYPLQKACLVEAQLHARNWEAALSAVDDALAYTVGKLATHHVPVLLRMKADALASLARRAAAEPLYLESLALCRAQNAKLLELQTSNAYAAFLRDDGRKAEARELLTLICSWFTEGQELADLNAARALIAALG